MLPSPNHRLLSQNQDACSKWTIWLLATAHKSLAYDYLKGIDWNPDVTEVRWGTPYTKKYQNQRLKNPEDKSRKEIDSKIVSKWANSSVCLLSILAYRNQVSLCSKCDFCPFCDWSWNAVGHAFTIRITRKRRTGGNHANEWHICVNNEWYNAMCVYQNQQVGSFVYYPRIQFSSVPIHRIFSSHFPLFPCVLFASS